MKKSTLKNRIFKFTLIASAMTSIIFSQGAAAALTEAKSTSTPTMQGYAPYLPSVGARYVNKDLTEYSKPLIGDIIEVPTYLLNEDWYTFRDGNATTANGEREDVDAPPAFLKAQDFDADNAINGRDREGQYLGQKVSVKWYVIKEKPEANGVKYVWADSIKFADNDTFLSKAKGLEGEALEQLFLDWETEANAGNPAVIQKIVRGWEDIDIQPSDVTGSSIDESYYIPMSNGSDSSLALRIPPEAGNKRIGFVITPESRTGDPARGTPLRVADLNFFWGQKPNTKPGDVCENPILPDSDTGIIDTTCTTDSGTPVKPNEDGPGGVVGLRQYMVNIRWSEDGSGIPKFDDRGQPTDPIVGAHPDAMFPATNEVYYAEIAILSGGNEEVDPNTPTPFSVPVNKDLYRLLENNTSNNENERNTVTWELTQHKFAVDANGVVSIDRTTAVKDANASLKLNWGADKTAESFINLTCTQDGLDKLVNMEITLDELADGGYADTAAGNNHPEGKCNPFTDHAFKTQVNNKQAQTFWSNVVNAPSQGANLLNEGIFPEMSEQLMSIQVTFQYENDGLEEGVQVDENGDPVTP
ncbi:hypothetical protein [Thorsellia anophelis]|uniref:Cell surface protein n=1 Tax=Thorsellia anophelis DSM 18579 TaxID=1123402 RepID=A0A1I0ALS3_9GAMM|nr:hypothetical protein [Thorsellia anophelis]SES95272.1 hypothetical protein SAMN02583745_00971 [Thorsellia anophelis DSM 18579]